MDKFRTASAIIVNDKGEILLTLRARDPYQGRWALPSGVGESKKGIPTFVGIIEEVACDITTKSFKGEFLFSFPIEHSEQTDVNDVYLGKVNEDEIMPAGEFSKGVKWVTPADIKDYMPLAFEHEQIIKRYLDLKPKK